MNQITLVLLIFAVEILCSCSQQKNETITTDVQKHVIPLKDNEAYEPTENLKFSIDDTLKIYKEEYFSNPSVKDFFVLTIFPGPVEDSKSEFSIETSDKKVIYREVFTTYYFIRGIYQPDTIPDRDKKVYEKYMEDYTKALTSKQYEAYFNKNTSAFFKDAIYTVEKRTQYLESWEENIIDKDFFAEITSDSTIILIDKICFDCYEGGEIMGYSKKQNKVVTLSGHD